MSKPTPDTSPGDEIEAILAEFSRMSDYTLKHKELALYLKSVEEAKDRLNRLMLTRERERLANLRSEASTYQNNDFDIDAPSLISAIPTSEIDEAIAAIDAQLNKEETDGDSK